MPAAPIVRERDRALNRTVRYSCCRRSVVAWRNRSGLLPLRAGRVVSAGLIPSVSEVELDTRADDPRDRLSDDDIRRFREAERRYLERHPDERWETKPRPDGSQDEDDARSPDEHEDKHGDEDQRDGKKKGDEDGEQDQKKKGMSRGKRLLLIAIAVIVVVGLAIAGWFYYQYSSQFASTDDAFVDTHLSQIAPRVSGQVESVVVDDNQHVNAGDLLLTIDTRDYRIKLDQAVAQRDNALAQLAQADAQVTLQRTNIDQAKANVTVAEADLTQAEQDYARFKNIDPKAITKQQLDNATAQLKSAQAKLQSAQQSVAGAEAQLKAAQSQVTAAKAQVENAETGIASAKLQLSYTTLNAPVTGRVTKKTVAVGNYVNPGAPLLAIVPDEMWVTANYKETQLAGMRPGQPVDIKVDAFPDGNFRGRVDSIQRGSGTVFSTLPAENATGNFVHVVQRVPVKIVFEDDRYKKVGIVPGLSVVPSVRVK